MTLLGDNNCVRLEGISWMIVGWVLCSKANNSVGSDCSVSVDTGNDYKYTVRKCHITGGYMQL